jgi:PAS domain S-box-containing protein
MLINSLIESNNLEQGIPSVSAAIAYNPLTVTSDTLVTDAIALMSNARATCTLETTKDETNYLLADARASCVLVMDNNQLLGIFTKRDVVHLSAEGRQIEGVVIADVMTHSVITIKQSDIQDLFAVLTLFIKHRIRHLPILDDHNHLVGLITHENLRQLLRPIDLLQLRLISEVMTSRIIHAEGETSVLDITKLMTREKVSSVVIVEPTNNLLVPIGIITERDIVQFQAMNLDLDCIKVETVMSSPVFSVSPQETLWTSLMLMEERRIHRIVITGEQGELLGFMTYTTLFQALNPLDIYKVVQVLEHKVCQLESEKVELLASRNTELEAEVQKRTLELQAQAERERLVSAIANRIRTSLDLEEILNSLAIEVRKVLKCDRVFVYQLDRNGNGIVIAEDVESGWLSLLEQEVFDPCFAKDWIQPYIQGRIRVINDIYTNDLTPCHQELLEHLQIRAKILVPIIVGDQLWGLMLACENDAPRIWQQEETELLKQLSTHVSIAIQQAELYQRLQLELQERKQAEIALSKSEERLRTIVETGASGFVTVDKRGKILFVNPAASRMFDRKIQELQGWPFALPYDCDGDQVQEIEILQPDGQRRKANMQPASISWNGEDAFLMSLSDITELKKTEELLRQSEGKYRLLVENLPLGLVAHAPDTSIITCNLKACELLELTLNQMRGKTALDPAWYFCRENETVMPVAEYPVNLVINTHKSLNNYVVGVNRPQTQTLDWMLVNAFPIFATDGNLEQVIITFVDISKRQEAERYRIIAEAKLQQLNEQLETRVEQRTIALQESITKQRRVKEALRYSEERFRIALNNSLIIVFNQDINLRYTWIYNSMLGWETEQVIGKFDQDLFSPEDSQKLTAWKRHVLSTGQSMTEEIVLGEDNNFTCYVLTIHPLRDRLGRIEGITCAALDITDRKKVEMALKESEHFVQRIAEASPDILYIYDLQEKRNIYVNREIARLIGYSPQEIQDIGDKFLTEIMHPDDVSRVIHHHNGFITASDQEIREIEYRMCDRLGNWHWFLSHDTIFSRDSNNLPKQIIGAASEITERRQIEEKLRQSNTELARATQLKDEFLANMSHELRTPLNAILGMSEGLQEEVFGKVNDQQKQAIVTIERSGKHLLELINDILDLSKIEAGKLKLQIAPVSCRSLCDSSLIFVRQQASKKNIQIITKVAANLPEIIVDERRFHQILINLLNNAVKFTPNGGEIQLLVDCVEKYQPQVTASSREEGVLPSPTSCQWVRFSVIDNGIGITETDLDTLFQPFMQIDSSLNRQYNGTGLGLSLVRQLVELHEGKITVTSKVHHGSCFQIYIPFRNNGLVSETQNQTATSLEKVSYIHKHSLTIILLSDDTKANTTTIINYLEARGYHLLLIQNEQEYVNIIKGENPDLIIIDIQISDIDGIETIKLLRADDQLQHIPIIVLHSLTISSNEQNYQQKCIALGANEYFAKPVKLKMILDKIQNLLN